MQREIKFRAWNKNKKMDNDVIPFVSPDNGKPGIMIIKRLTGKCEWEEVIALMQYTGLKDKNGIEIYESDIVKGNNWVGEVKWLTFGWFVHRYNADGEVEEDFAITDYPFKVIGNVYENSELLKEVDLK